MGSDVSKCGGLCGPQAPEETAAHQVQVEPEPQASRNQQDYAPARHPDGDGLPPAGSDVPTHGGSGGQADWAPPTPRGGDWEQDGGSGGQADWATPTPRGGDWE